MHVGLKGRADPDRAAAAEQPGVPARRVGLDGPAQQAAAGEAGAAAAGAGASPQDRVAIVVYAGAAGLVLPPTPGSDKATILAALDSLRRAAPPPAARASGWRTRWRRQHFVSGGNNRVILATDGDFNVGVSSDAATGAADRGEARDGIFLTVLGFGTGNLKDGADGAARRQRQRQLRLHRQR